MATSGAKPANKRPETLHQLKIVLRNIDPPVWRRVSVSSQRSLRHLHNVIQAAMGWTESHLHLFSNEAKEYGDPHPETPAMRDERNAKLFRLLQEKDDTLNYLYDFGDGWEHEIILEDILPAPEPHLYPRCIAGARACPPEDCGGPHSYEELVQALKDQEPHQWSDWIDPEFDPEGFDLEKANTATQHTW